MSLLLQVAASYLIDFRRDMPDAKWLANEQYVAAVLAGNLQNCTATIMYGECDRIAIPAKANN